MEKVSVIVPAYNVESYIHRAIESVIGQTYENVELVVVDDGSEDNTWNIIKKYAKQDVRIKAIRQKNQGVSAARNTALDALTGDYAVFLDSDDWLEEGTVEYLLNLQAAHEGLLVAGSFYSVRDDHGTPYKKSQKKQRPLSIVDVREAMMNIGTSKYYLRSSCYKLFNVRQIGTLRFDAAIYQGEDGLFVFEYLQKCAGLVFSTEPLWNILMRPGSATRAPYNDKWLTAMDAAEKMLVYANDEEINDALVLNVIDRAQIVEKFALKGRGPNIRSVRCAREEQKKYARVFFGKKRSIKLYIKYFVYTYMPIWMVKGVVRILSTLKKN